MATPAARLDHIATLERIIQAPLERIWENVLDWEHLPWLHHDAFAAIERIDSGAWGWRARLRTTRQPDEEMTVEIRLERPALRYVTRTVEGPGQGAEIWTRLEPRDDDATAIRVEFWLPDVPAPLRDRIGAGYKDLYQRLWDEDEQMMRMRGERLVAPLDRASGSVELGRLRELSARLPLLVTAAGERWRVTEVDGALVVHSTRCPHLLGPLDGADGEGLEPHEVRCPWHGYRFDVRSGRSCDGRGLRLREPPGIEVGRDECVMLHFGRP